MNEKELLDCLDTFLRDQGSYLEEQKGIADDLIKPGDSAARYRQAFAALVEGEDPNMRLARMGLC